MVWNRTSARCADLERRGATVAPSLPDAIAASSLTVSVIVGHNVVQDAVDAADAHDLVSGASIVWYSIGTPNEVRRFAEWAKGIGVNYLDAAIGCYPRDIGPPNAIIAYAVDAELFERPRSTFAVLDGTPHHIGENIIAAAVRDHADLAFYYATLSVGFQAGAIMEANGYTLDDMAEFVPETLPVSSSRSRTRPL